MSETSRPFLVTRRVASVAIVVIERIPSNFGSNHHAGSSNAFQPPSASIGWNAGGEAISGACWLEARKASQSVLVLTKWNSRPGYRRPWRRKLTFESVHSTGSYHPSSKILTSPAP